MSAQEKYLKSEADCTHKAKYYKSCSICGETGEETFEYGEARGHNYENYLCTICGEVDPDTPETETLEYLEILEDGEVVAYSVSGIGTVTDNIIVIPSIYNDKPVTSIGSMAFYQCSGLTSVYWNATNCTSAGPYEYPIFNNCNNLQKVIIGEQVEAIPAYAFLGCSGLEKVYYNGTAENWAEISIDIYNISLTGAMRYYYSEEQPAEEGNYWHYVDGEVAEW